MNDGLQRDSLERRQPREAHTSGDAVLSVRGLQTEFPARDGLVKAVRDVSLDLRRGEKLGLVGESGSGKSAFALSVLGLLQAPGRVVGGEIWLNGREISALSDRKMRKIRGREISLIFQDPMTALNPVKPVGNQLVEAIRIHQPELGRAGARRLAIQLLEDVRIPFAERRLEDYPHQYSGGMRQRVIIAIALANRPDVLIADEPTTALDVTTQAQVLDILDRLVTEQGTAVILITHNLGIVSEFCGSVCVMYAGRVVERASTYDLFVHSIHPYTEALLNSVPRPDRLEKGPLKTILGKPPNLASLPPGCPFEPRCPVGNGVEICMDVVPAPMQVHPGGHSVIAECHFAEERVRERLTRETREAR
jgi:oligopeptide/dipeptide ABC transporter ATP-binding protein